MNPVTEAPARLYPVRLLPDDRVFHVGSEEDILTAGLRQGVDLRYGCRHGQCTTCKYVVVEGDVVHKGASPYAFSARESEEGGILLCSTFARSPLVISAYGEHPPADGPPIIPPEERTARVVSMTPVVPDLVEVRLRTEVALPYRAGQYVEIAVPGGGKRRSYSMTTPPDASGELRFLVEATHRRLLEALTSSDGADVTVFGPLGRFFHRPGSAPILMVASGAGLGPLLAILRDVLGAGGAPRITLYYGALPGAIPYADELEGLAAPPSGFDFLPVDLPAHGAPLLRLGPIVRQIAREVPDASGYDAYVAGPVPLCDAVESLLTAKGLPEHRCFAERFY
jgi:propane monooxygenase reductase component